MKTPNKQPHKHTYDLKIYNGRVKVYIDGFVMFIEFFYLCNAYPL